jgi:hypothetical protein
MKKKITTKVLLVSGETETSYPGISAYSDLSQNPAKFEIQLRI